MGYQNWRFLRLQSVSRFTLRKEQRQQRRRQKMCYWELWELFAIVLRSSLFLITFENFKTLIEFFFPASFFLFSLSLFLSFSLSLFLSLSLSLSLSLWIHWWQRKDPSTTRFCDCIQFCYLIYLKKIFMEAFRWIFLNKMDFFGFVFAKPVCINLRFVLRI